MERVKDYREWTMDDIVYENRNKAYGSYQNKHAIPRNIMISLTASVLGFLMLVLPFAIDWNQLGQMPEEKENITAVNLSTPVISLHPPPPPPPPPVLPPPVRPSVRYTEMVVKEEPEIDESEDENPAPLYETEEQDISTVTNAGDTSLKGVKPDTLPPVAKVVPVDTMVYEFVDQRPEFPGGDEALNSFVQSHIRYPDEERSRRMEGTVLVIFVVREDGSVADVRIPVGVSSGFAREALRVVKTLPKFRPGRLQGRAVRVYFHVPVFFDLKSI